ncbi:MAG: NUDIX domain-containing protein [Treponema sp.]|nr:NUDIX domain-containing protein [Treponema sp.]
MSDLKKSVACICTKDKKILIAHRNPTGQMGNRWEFPGGKVEGDDTEVTAIVREMHEEFNVKATALEKITEGSFEHNGKVSMLEVYHVELEHDGIQKPYDLTEHTEYKWISIYDIPKDNFVDSDLSVYDKVVEFLEKENLV